MFGDESIHRLNCRLRGKDFLRQNAVNFRIGVDSRGVFQYDYIWKSMSNARRRVERVIPLVENAEED